MTTAMEVPVKRGGWFVPGLCAVCIAACHRAHTGEPVWLDELDIGAVVSGSGKAWRGKSVDNEPAQHRRKGLRTGDRDACADRPKSLEMGGFVLDRPPAGIQ